MKIQLSLFPTNYCEVCHSEVEGDYAVCSVKCQIKLNEKTISISNKIANNLYIQIAKD